MAKNKRGRHYKMTPRRKAALRKAQAASARARRRRVGRAGALVGATLVAGGIAAAVGARRYQSTQTAKLKTHKRTVAHNKIKAKVARRDRFIATLPKPQLALTAGKPKKTVIPPGWGKSDLPPKRQIKTTPKTVFKVSSQGIVTRTTKKRMAYDTNRRRKYWQGKPVGGAPCKKYTSTKRGRR